MRLQALKARPRRRRLPPDLGARQSSAVAPYVAAVIDLFSRRVVGWSMSAAMTAQFVPTPW
jgi:putative transposase